MKREKMIEWLVDQDMDSIFTGHIDGDNSFLYDILMTGWKGYDLMTDKELKEEYNEKKPQ